MSNDNGAMQISLYLTTRLQGQGDSIKSLLDIVECYRRNIILKPPHQRDVVWAEEKKTAWIARLRSGKKPVGVIVTYQIIDGPVGPVNLNDGFQRISATLDYLNAPEKYGDSLEEAQDICRNCEMPVQHRYYLTNEDALADFQALNMGTALTALEFFKGALTYMKNWDQWSPIIDELHGFIPSIGQRIVSTRSKTSREEKHKQWRADYAMFHRFCNKSNPQTDYNVAGKYPKQKLDGKFSTIEWILRELLENMTPSQGQQELIGLRRLIERETALIETIWHDKLGKARGEGISVTVYRWLIEVAIWKRNAGISNESWESFLYKFLSLTNGACMVFDSTRTHHYTVSLSRLSLLKGVCDYIGSDLYLQNPHRREKTLKNLKPGYDESHVLPFSEHGNGPTFPEPAGRNRARGAKPVDVSTAQETTEAVNTAKLSTPVLSVVS